MIRRLRRWAGSGRFATQADVASNPEATVTETVTDDASKLRWRCATLESVMLQAAGSLRIAESAAAGVADRLELVAHDRIPEEQVS